MESGFNTDFTAYLIDTSPSHVALSPEQRWSPLWKFLDGNDDQNASSFTLPLVRSPSRLQDVEMEGCFNDNMNLDDATLINNSPNRVPPSPQPGVSHLSFPDGNSDGKDFSHGKESSFYLSLTYLRKRGISSCSITELKRLEVSLTFLNKLSLVDTSSLPSFAPSRNSIVTRPEDEIHIVDSHPENENTKKISKRKISLEDLLNFPGTRLAAANSLGVSLSTIKRLCKDHGINWRDRNINKNNQSLSKPEDIIEFVQGEGAEMGNQIAGGNRLCERELNHEQIDFPPESEKGSGRSHIGVGIMEESSTQMEITPVGNMFVPSTHEQCIEAVGPLALPVHPSELNLPGACLEPDAVNFTLPQTPEGESLIDHNISATVASNTKKVPESCQSNRSCSDPAPKLTMATTTRMMPLITETQNTRTVTMKASYKENMIRFQLSLTSGIIELRKVVATKLTLEVGTFGIKYLDDEEDWILMTDHEDLQVCFNLGRKVIKLSIHDMPEN